MKKQIFGIAALSLLFVATSCSNETIESGNDLKNQISFRAALGKQTKASEFTDWTAGNTLTVNSYPVNSSVLTKAFTLSYLGASAWNNTTPFNQPGYALRYYSYYPTSNVATPAASVSSYSFDYTIQAAQEDLIAATVTTDLAAVTLPFTHILSQVNFALVKIPGVKIEIDNIWVNDVKKTGTYTFGATSNAGTWSSLEAPENFAYAYLSGTNTTDGTDAGISYMGNGGSDFTNNNALMLMPQGFAAEEDGTFSFSYKLSSVKSDGTYGTAIEGNVTANLCDFDVTTWAQGKRYLYLIDFSTFLAGGPITFTVTLSEWEDAPLVAETLQVADAELVSIEAAIAKHSAANVANSSLKVFPIAVPEDLAADLAIENISGFDAGDQIRIEFPTNDGAEFLSLDAGLTDWDLEVIDRVVILTKK